MNRPSVLLVATLLVLAGTPIALGAPPAMSMGSGAPAAQATNATGTPPGAGVSSVLGVQAATIDRSIEAAAFRARLSATDTPAARARVVAAAANRTETRLAALERRLDALQSDRANGSVGDDAYATRTAPVAASARSLDARLDLIRTAAAGLDGETLRNAGVSHDRIEALQSRIDRVLAASEDRGAAEGPDREFYRRLAAVAATHNENVAGGDLGVLGSHLDGERINLQIVGEDGDTDVVSFRTTEDVRVRELRAGPHPDATLRVRVDESTARRLVNSDDPAAATNEAFFSGAISIHGLGPYNALKWAIASTVLDVARALAGLLGSLLSLLP